MTPEQRQERVDLLRQMADWLEDGTELEECTSGKWVDLGSHLWNAIGSWVGKVRAKPKPLERSIVLLACGDCTFTDADDAKRYCDVNSGLRIVHLREVTE